MLADLAALPLVRSSFPRLHAAMQAALQHFASTQLHTGKLAALCVRCSDFPSGRHGAVLPSGDVRRVLLPLPPVARNPLSPPATPCSPGVQKRRTIRCGQVAAFLACMACRPSRVTAAGHAPRFAGWHDAERSCAWVNVLAPADSPPSCTCARGFGIGDSQRAAAHTCRLPLRAAGGAAAHQQPRELPGRVVQSDEGGGGAGACGCLPMMALSLGSLCSVCTPAVEPAASHGSAPLCCCLASPAFPLPF